MQLIHYLKQVAELEAPIVEEYIPMGHAIQLVIAIWAKEDEEVPSRQGKQAADTEPLFELYVPLGHAWHEDAPVWYW